MIEQQERNYARPLSAVREGDEFGDHFYTDAIAAKPTAPEQHQQQRSSDVDQNQKFDALIENMFTSFAECQSNVQELLQLKDDLLVHFLPPALMLRISVVIGKVYRSFSDLNTPSTEMIRLARICTASWEKNTAVLKKVYDMYETKKQILNVAIKRLAAIDKKNKLLARDKRLANWEKLYMRMSEAKGHGRRWKFQMETFRQKANDGYDHLVRWALREQQQQQHDQRPTKDKKKDAAGDESRLSLINNLRSPSNDGNNNENRLSDNDDDIDEVDSDDNDLFSDRGGNRNREAIMKDMRSVEMQTEPLVDNKETWTGEPEYSRYLIVRLFKPVELNAKRVRFRITFKNLKFTSRYFDPKKPIEKKPDAGKNKLLMKKPAGAAKSLPFGSNDASAPPKEDKTLDTANYQDFLIEMPDYFNKKRSSDNLSITDIENSIQFEIQDEETSMLMDSADGQQQQLIGYSMVQLDDIHTLDLPILYYQAVNDLEVINFYDENQQDSLIESSSNEMMTVPAVNEETTKKTTPRKKAAAEQNNLVKVNDLTPESSTTYSMLAKRSPFTFTLYKTKENKTKENTCGKLPLLFFWIRKPWVFKYDKNTGCQSIKDIVYELTGLNIEKNSRHDIDKLFKDLTLVSHEDMATSPIPFETEKEKEKEKEKVNTKKESGASKADKRVQLKDKETLTEKAVATAKIEKTNQAGGPAAATKTTQNANTNTVAKQQIETATNPMTPTPSILTTTTTTTTINNNLIINNNQTITNISRADDESSIHAKYQDQIELLRTKMDQLEDELVQLRAQNEQLRNSQITQRSSLNQLSRLSQAKQAINKNNNHNNIYQPFKPVETKPNRIQHNKFTWDNDLPDDFLERLKTFAERSDTHHKELVNKYQNEEATIREQQMAVHHRLDSTGLLNSKQNDKYDDFCLPAVFMPFKSPNNVFNPRAHRYFHPNGSTDVRLTQPPSIVSLPPLPAKPTVSVINLFELSKRYEEGMVDTNEFYINEYLNRAIDRLNRENNNKAVADQQPFDAIYSTEQDDDEIEATNNDDVDGLLNKQEKQK